MGVAVTTARAYRAAEQHKRYGGSPAKPTDADYAPRVQVKAASDLPRGPLFLDGVPLLFLVTGEFRAL